MVTFPSYICNACPSSQGRECGSNAQTDKLGVLEVGNPDCAASAPCGCVHQVAVSRSIQVNFVYDLAMLPLIALCIDRQLDAPADRLPYISQCSVESSLQAHSACLRLNVMTWSLLWTRRYSPRLASSFTTGWNTALTPCASHQEMVARQLCARHLPFTLGVR